MDDGILTPAKTFWVALSLASVLGLFYGSALDQYFHHDDFIFLERSSFSSTSDWVSASSIERNQRGLTEKKHSYRPLSTNLYFGLTQKSVGLDARAFHRVNLFTLVGIATLLVVLLVQLGFGLWPSLALAVIYGVSPIQYQTQLWISVFQELSFAVLELLAIVIHIGSDRSRRTGSVVVLGLFLAALLCKEMAISLPAILLCWELFVRRSGPRAAVTATGLLWVAAGGYLAIRSALLSIPSEGPYAIHFGFFVSENLWAYVDWSVHGLCLTSDGRLEIVLLLLAAIGIRFASSRGRGLVVFGVLWFLIALSPVVFMPNHLYRYYLVFPVLGVVISAAALLAPLGGWIRPKALRAVAVVPFVLGIHIVSDQEFETAASRRERQTGRSQSIFEQLRALHPTLPDGTQVYLSAPADFVLPWLLKDSGASLRVVYGNSTLRADPLTEEVDASIGSSPAGLVLGFSLDTDGVLRAHPGNPRAGDPGQ